MKQFFLIILVCTSLLIHAQSNTAFTVHGFRQRVSPGMQGLGDIDEQGKLLKKESSPLINYSIYAINNLNEVIQPVHVWIAGKPFSVKTDTVQKPPVVYKNKGTSITVTEPLLPETSGTILRLWPQPVGPAQETRKGKRLAQNHDLVVAFKTKTGVQYGVLKKFTELPQGILQ